eukprot:COSAG02_NODE_2693_length_8220_cov_3.340106_9_plen_556_part_00
MLGSEASGTTHAIQLPSAQSSVTGELDAPRPGLENLFRLSNAAGKILGQQPEPSEFRHEVSPRDTTHNVPGILGSPIAGSGQQLSSPKSIAPSAKLKFSPASSFIKPATPAVTSAAAVVNTGLPGTISRASGPTLSFADPQSPFLQMTVSPGSALVEQTDADAQFLFDLDDEVPDIHDPNRLPATAHDGDDLEVAELTSYVYDGSLLATKHSQALGQIDASVFEIDRSPEDIEEYPLFDQRSHLQSLMKADQSVIVRTAKISDLNDLSHLNEAFAIETDLQSACDQDSTKQWMTVDIGKDESIKDDIIAQDVICLEQGTLGIRGFLLSRDQMDPKSAEWHCYISTLFVARGSRGQGFARMLLSQAILDSNTRGQAESIALLVAPCNNKAQKLYESFGFAKTGEQRDHNVMTAPMDTAFEKAIAYMARRTVAQAGSRSSPRLGISAKTSSEAESSSLKPTRWSDSEIEQLMELVLKHGESDWASVAAALGSGRTAKAARTKYNSLSQERRYYVEEIIGEGVDGNGYPAYCARPSVASAVDHFRQNRLGLSVDAPGM